MRFTFGFLISVVLMLVQLTELEAQIWLSNEDIYNEADEYLLAEDYKEALSLYLLLEKKGIINDNIRYKISECYLNIDGKKQNAIPYLETAINNVSCNYIGGFEEVKAPSKAIELLGIAYRINHEFDRAISTFRVLKDTLTACDPFLIPTIDLHIRKCKNAKYLKSNELNYRSELVQIKGNNQFSNYNPVVLNDEQTIFFMSEFKFYDAIMKASLAGTATDKPGNYTPILGSDGDHVLAGASTDGTELFFHIFSDNDSEDIYSSKLVNGEWSSLELLPSSINTHYNETYASFSSKTNTLFFTSNKPGGQGGDDIYSCRKNSDGTWTQPVNLGVEVNTIFNEATPFYSDSEDRLYFSSRGHFNIGGYDIFVTEYVENEGWTQPVNVGYPISTPDDDVFYYPVNDKVGYISRFLNEKAEQFSIYRIYADNIGKLRTFRITATLPPNLRNNQEETYSLLIVNTEESDTVVNQ
ncbi:MAG: hypothetical protein MI922_17820, partial [Bacteroidales bacterium]|nr:hypothetical protein [Bacteroidales bacterium]